MRLPRITAEEAAAIVGELEATASAQADSVGYTAQEGFPFEYELGSSARRCVDVHDARYARSGEFVAFSFVTYWGNWINGSSGLRYQPKYLGHPVQDSIAITIVRLDRRVSQTTYVLRGAGWAAGQAHFFGHNIMLPGPGRWLLLVSGGPNWGCFIYRFPIVGRVL
jgi:hypothetical protein